MKEQQTGTKQTRHPQDSHEQDGKQGHGQGGHSPMMRGATRPQMHMGDGHGEMSAEDRDQMQRQHHSRTLWVYLLIMLLGVWLALSPFTFGYQSPGLVSSRTEQITAIRNLPAISTRALLMTWSDVLSGLALVGLAALSLNPRRVWAPWATCIVGVWLLFAPLLFWAPTAAAYAMDTLIGALVIALTILIPGMPGMILIMKMGPETPPGWSYNPSSWLQRVPIIVLGWVGFFISRYLAAYQFGYIDYVWDPFFGDGTMRILDSDVSLAWPISDAGLGAISYMLEALMGYMGGTQRWRTMPWMVTFFGILVIPLGAVSIALVIMQPLAVGTWCTLCLITALAMLIMIPLTLDEVIAMAQFVWQRTRHGASLWRTFVFGDTIEGGGKDERSPPFTAPLRQSVPASIWGMGLPWTLLMSAALGLWLMLAPAVFGSQGAAADSDHLVGSLIVSFAVISLAEVGRPVRFVNVLLGGWLIFTPLFLAGYSGFAGWNDVIVGVLVIVLSGARGTIREQYGTFDRYLV